MASRLIWDVALLELGFRPVRTNEPKYRPWTKSGVIKTCFGGARWKNGSRSMRFLIDDDNGWAVLIFCDGGRSERHQRPGRGGGRESTYLVQDAARKHYS